MANRWKGNFVVAANVTSSGTDYTGKANGAWSLNSQLQQKQGGLWAKGQSVSAAPTSVTATVGNAQSVISFTAPTDNGGLAITGYTVTSSTGGITATGSASPITITGLTNGTAYTFTVTATNAIGTGPSSSPSNSVTPTAGPQIGDAMGGGFYAGKISTTANGVATHYLIVAPKATGESPDRTWGSNTTTGVTSVINGPTNSASLAALGASYQAAVFAEGLTIGGYSDWYLPAKNELEVLYYFLKPTTAGNNTSSGSNANAVSPEPVNTNYTSGSPAQTSAGIGFRTDETNGFFYGGYWTSTETSASTAWFMDFYDGTQYSTIGKSNALYVRAVRRIAI